MKRKRRRLSLRTTLNLTFLTIALLPIVFSHLMLYRLARTWGNDLLVRETNSQIQMNCLRVETLLSSIEKSIDLLVDSAELQALIRSMNTEDSSDYLEYQREFGEIASKYFDNGDTLLGVELVMPKYTISWSDRLGISKDHYQQSYIVQDLNNTFGKIKWYSTYNGASMFRASKVSQVGAETQTVFTAGQRIIVNDGGSRGAHPVLMVHLRPSLFQAIFKTDGLFSDTVYMVVDNYGNVIYENVPNFFYTHKFGLLKKVYSGIAGIETQVQDGMVLNFMLVRGLDWKLLSATPASGAVKYFWQGFFMPAVILALCSVGLALAGTVVLARRYAIPLQELVNAIDRTAQGDLVTPISMEAATTHEFQTVFRRYNAMHQNIQALIQENSDSKLREKELEIQVLNLQYNPHFLYNTLNSINLLAITYDQHEISEMLTNLSSILRYSVNVKENIVKFSEDFAYIQSYVALMQARYDHQFAFTTQIQPEVFEQRVPEFILQPLIENAILHGVQGMPNGVTISITAWIENDELTFVLADNGRGMDAGDAPSGQGSMIGLSNTKGRLQFYYGDHYTLEVESSKESGTCITIRLSTHIF